MNQSSPALDDRSQPRRGRLRRTTVVTIAAAATLLGLGATVPLLQSAAGATDPCPSPQVKVGSNAAPAVCPGPGTTVPPTAPPFDFSARTFTLADGASHVQQPITMTRSFLVPSATHPDTPDVVAGGSDTVDGADLFGVDGGPPPGASAAVIAMHEAGVRGPICRSQQFAPTANFAFVHMLTSDAQPVSGDLVAFLSAVSGGHFAGGTNGLPSNFDVSTNGVSEVLGSDGAHLTVRGNLTINTGPAIWKFTFTHRFTMAIAPATDVNAAHVLALTTPTAGQLVLMWNQTPPANGDNILKFVQGLIEPVMRPLVPTKIARSLNLIVPTQHDVKFFLEQGFTFSVRDVAITPATTDSTGKVTDNGALALLPAFCKVEPHP